MREKYTHFNLGDGVITVCHTVEERLGVARDKRVQVEAGFSFCAPESQFCRKYGRFQAFRNLWIQRRKLEKGSKSLPHKGATLFQDFAEHLDLPIIDQSEAALNYYIDHHYNLLPKWMKVILKYDLWDLNIRAKRQNRFMRRNNNVSAHQDDQSRSANS